VKREDCKTATVRLKPDATNGFEPGFKTAMVRLKKD